mgnify:CR=1 FL=1|jgi:hypothetical protein
MNVLEKILEEIEEYEKKKCSGGSLSAFESGINRGCLEAKNIIRSHMNDVENDGWILVEEKLPEEENERYYPMLNVATSYGAVKWGFYRVRDKQWYIYSEIHDEFIEARDKEIVAWQRLPDRYKGE